MKRVIISLVFLLVFASASEATQRPLAQTKRTYPFTNPKQEAQFKHLLTDLRCLVCQNQDLADSNAPLAKDLRDQVYQMVQNGKTDTEISQYLTDRYGDFVLFKPPLKAITYLLWFGPFLFLIAGFIIFWRTSFKRVAYE